MATDTSWYDNQTAATLLRAAEAQLRAANIEEELARLKLDDYNQKRKGLPIKGTR